MVRFIYNDLDVTEILDQFLATTIANIEDDKAEKKMKSSI